MLRILYHISHTLVLARALALILIPSEGLVAAPSEDEITRKSATSIAEAPTQDQVFALSIPQTTIGLVVMSAGEMLKNFRGHELLLHQPSFTKTLGALMMGSGLVTAFGFRFWTRYPRLRRALLVGSGIAANIWSEYEQAMARGLPLDTPDIAAAALGATAFAVVDRLMCAKLLRQIKK